MNTYFCDKFNNIKFHSNILCIILRIKYLVKYVVLHVKSLRWMRPTIIFCHESAEEVTHDTRVDYFAIAVKLTNQFSIFVAVLAMEDSCSLITVLLFPHWFHWSAALITQNAAGRYFCAFPHSLIHFVGANFVVFGEGAPCCPHCFVMIVSIDDLFLAREVTLVTFGVGYYCPFLFSHISISLSFLFCSQDTAWSWLFGRVHTRSIRICGHLWGWHQCTTSHTVHCLYSCLSSYYYLLNVRPCLLRARDRWIHRT